MSPSAPQVLAERLLHFAGRRILVLGDIILDRYFFGTVERISPEGPIPVLRATRNATTLGGAGNVANNIASLGGNAVLVGAIGDDEGGAAVARALALVPGIEPALVIVPGRPTTVKTRFVAGRQQLLRVDEEIATPIGGAVAAALLEQFEAALPDCDAVVLSDYAKGVFGDALLTQAIAAARQAGKPIIADPKSLDFRRYAGVTVLKPNRGELARATQVEIANDVDAERAAHLASELIGGGALLVTRSEQGLTLVCDAEPALHLKTQAREVADVSGAGDTFAATLALGLAAGADLADAAALANFASGICVGKLGTATVTISEIADALHLRDILTTESKVATLPTALERIAAWRRAGLSVGFTNGCFDLIHPGHVTLLAKARASCDRLVVGLNADESVKRLKGPERPVQAEHARATVLASLAAVDMVILFGEDTPLALIDAIKPEILVKGADYRIDQVVGADIVTAHGGRVVLVDLVQGHSTTSTIARIGGG